MEERCETALLFFKNTYFGAISLMMIGLIKDPVQEQLFQTEVMKSKFAPQPLTKEEKSSR